MFALVISALVITLNHWHVITAWFSKPQGTYFTGIAHYYADYFLYVSLMAQQGFVFTNHLFTNEPLPPTWIYWLYTILGKLGNPFFIYNLTIVIFSIVLLFLWWKVIQQVVATRLTQNIAFLFVATASGFAGHDFWFSPTPALNRLGGVPHQIFQTILLLSVVLLFIKRKYVLVSIVAFFAAVANPIQMFLVSIALIITKPITIIYLIPAAFGAFLTNAEFSRDPILSAAKAWENNQNITISIWRFILAVGPIVFFVPFGLKQYILKLTPLQKIVLLYGALSLLMFFSPIPRFFGTSPVRWLSPAAYGILPILAGLGMSTKTNRLALFIIFYAIFTLPSLVYQIEARMQAPKSLNYVPQDVVKQLHAIASDGVVLTHPSLPYDILVPVFTGNKTFTGHPIHTLYPELKEDLRKNFFSGRMTEEEKKQFIIDHNITTIIP